MLKPISKPPTVPLIHQSQVALEKLERHWRTKFVNSAFISPKSVEQQTLIETYLDKHIALDSFFENAIDFGCGKGRLVPYLAKFCGHVWAVDIVPELLPLAKDKALNCSTGALKWPISLPGPKGQDLLFACMVFQHITDEPLLSEIIRTLHLWLKPDARIIILENATDRGMHVKPRAPNVFANAFNMKTGWTAERITLDKANDHWLIDGLKA